MGKFIVNFTPTGMIPTKRMTPHVPVDVEEIVKEVLDARKFGVSIIHLHARDAEGKPTWKKEVYKKIIDGIRAVDGYTNDSLILCVPVSGQNGASIEEYTTCLELEGASKPDMGSLSLNSIHLSDTASSFEMIQKLALKMKENGVKPGLEIVNAEMITLVKSMQDKGIIEPPFYFNTVFNNGFSEIKTELSEAALLVSQLPANSYWTFGGTDASQLTMNTMAILQGGGIRIGIGDNIYFDEEQTHLASNEDLLDRMNEIATLLDSAPHTPAEVREMLNMEVE